MERREGRKEQTNERNKRMKGRKEEEKDGRKEGHPDMSRTDRTDKKLGEEIGAVRPLNRSRWGPTRVLFGSFGDVHACVQAAAARQMASNKGTWLIQREGREGDGPRSRRVLSVATLF
jgi:hypothetical protein